MAELRDAGVQHVLCQMSFGYLAHEHILASITRAIVIEATGAAERSCTLDELLEADEAFLASTTRDVQPVSALDDRTFDAPGPVTARTAESVAALVRRQLDAETSALGADTR